MPRGRKKRIHINRHIIDSNKKKGQTEDPITIKMSDRNIYTDTVDIVDSKGNLVASVVYRPETPLSCGASVWIETNNSCWVNGEVV